MPGTGPDVRIGAFSCAQAFSGSSSVAECWARPIRVRAGFVDRQSSLLLWSRHEEEQRERDDEKTCEKHGHSCNGQAVVVRKLLALCEFRRAGHSFPRYPVARFRGSGLKLSPSAWGLLMDLLLTLHPFWCSDVRTF